MNGTNEEDIFFQETKKIKRERFKWLTLLTMTNVMTCLLMLPAPHEEKVVARPWPAHWVEITVEADILASGELPMPVTLLNSQGEVVFAKAFLVAKETESSTFHQQKSARFMLEPNELPKLKQRHAYKALPYSTELGQAPAPKRKNYEVHF